MSKLYFAKFIPIDGDIMENDWYITYHNGSPISVEQSISEGPLHILDEERGHASIKKAKLMLCSRDIQVGDTCKHFTTLNGYNDVIVKDKDDFGCTIRGDYTKGHAFSKDLIKVIGEISPEAKWLRGGEEFDEDQILRDILVKEYDSEAEEYEYTHFHPKGNEVFKLGQYEKFIEEKPIKIECPCCGTFK
jgi:hypothetical protein